MKILRFVKKVFFTGLTILSNFTSVNSLSCISMSNQPCKARPEIINVNSNNPIFYCFSIKANKCSGNCNNINDPYSKICVPDIIKNLNVKVFNLMSRTNETRFIEWHETCKCECRLDAIVCNNKQRWNNDIQALFGILVIVNVNVINHVILVSIQIMKIVNAEKG